MDWRNTAEHRYPTCASTYQLSWLDQIDNINLVKILTARRNPVRTAPIPTGIGCRKSSNWSLFQGWWILYYLYGTLPTLTVFYLCYTVCFRTQYSLRSLSRPTHILEVVLEATQGQIQSNPIQMPPCRGGICGGLTYDLPWTRLQGGRVEHSSLKSRFQADFETLTIREI